MVGIFTKQLDPLSINRKILKHIGVKSVKMLTENVEKVNTLTQLGIDVTGIQPLTL